MPHIELSSSLPPHRSLFFSAISTHFTVQSHTLHQQKSVSLSTFLQNQMASFPFLSQTLKPQRDYSHGSDLINCDLSLSIRNPPVEVQRFNGFTIQDCETALAQFRLRQNLIAPKIKSENEPFSFPPLSNPSSLSSSNQINNINFNINHTNSASSSIQEKMVSFPEFYRYQNLNPNPNPNPISNPRARAENMSLKVKKEVEMKRNEGRGRGESSRSDDEGVIRSLRSGAGKYICPKCNKVCDSAQLFACHVKRHYVNETPDERRRRLRAKVKRRMQKNPSRHYKIVNSDQGITVVPRT